MNDLFSRIWEHISGRMSGPLHLRFIVQPLVAASVALRAGTVTSAREWWTKIAIVCAMAFALDTLYQVVIFRWFYPGEALLIALLLAVLPYACIRGAMRYGH